MRLSGITIGQYLPGDSPLHRLDPRVKIIASLLFVIVLFAINGFAALALMAAFLAAAIALARIPLSWLYRGLKPVLFLILITFIFQLAVPAGEELARLGPFVIRDESLANAGFLSLRLVLLFLSGSILTLTTPPVLLTDAFSRLMAPLAWLKVPVFEIALMMTIALRFIPTLLMELDRIIKAQAARGASIYGGGPLRRARAVLPVLLPLFVMSFRHADELALAMESRCYRGGRGRTVRRKLHYGWRDAAFGVILAGVLVAALWLGRFQ